MRIEYHRPQNARYQEYLKSPAWKRKRKAVRARCGGICERCRKYLLDEVHHLTYAHIYDEPLDDLQGLCRPCHAFLHNDSGIDPLAKSIQVKITGRIEYWDVATRKVRRVSTSKLLRPMVDDGTDTMGIYRVPMNIFLDGKGEPVFDPARWQQYRTAYRTRKGWMRYGNEGKGRSIPRDAAARKREVEAHEQRVTAEEQRLQDSPATFTSYEGRVPKTDKEVWVGPIILQH
jgi:hypothetical protein